MNGEKAEVVNGIIYRYSTSWIHKLETEEHWRLYWYQQRLMEGRVQPGQSVLEIGVGSGFTANYLRSKGINVTTLDIDADKRPDIVANIVTFGFNNVFDHILAFEVFEHIPFEKFVEVIEKLSKVCRRHLFMSVPRCERVLLRLEYRVPILGHGSIELAIRRKKIVEPHHYWEVDHGRVTCELINDLMSKANFKLLQRYKKFSRIFFAFEKVGEAP